MTVNLGGKLLDLSSPLVMAIVNVTPDSFYPGSRAAGTKAVLEKTAQALREGAAIIDLGGYSSRPGADDVPAGEECRRVGDALEAIRKEFGQINISVDTFRSEVVRRAYDCGGPVIVNDITAGRADSAMLPLAGGLGLPFIAMHMKGTPKTMKDETRYGDLVGDILRFFAGRLEACREAGVKDVILDAGFGFAKNTAQNFELLRRHNELRVLGRPLLGGISRKTMIWKTLGTTPSEALNGTTALHWELLRSGASILRAHDVREAAETVRLYEACYGKSGFRFLEND